MPQIDLDSALDAGAAAPRLTLLDLVSAVGEFARSEAEVVAVVLKLIESRRVMRSRKFCRRTARNRR